MGEEDKKEAPAAGIPGEIKATHIAVPVETVVAAAGGSAMAGIRPRQLMFGFGLLFFWFLLLMCGHEVNSAWARRIVSAFVNSRLLPQETRIVQSTGATRESAISTQALLVTFKLGEQTLETRTLTLPKTEVATVAGPAPTDVPSFIKGLIVTLFAWTWPNLILLSATASGFAACFCRRVEKISELATEIGWSVVNGMFVVSLLACSQVFFGDSVDKSLGISSALRVAILQENYLRLAFFSSLLGMFLGLAESRVSALPGRLPIIGKILGPGGAPPGK